MEFHLKDKESCKTRYFMVNYRKYEKSKRRKLEKISELWKNRRSNNSRI